MCRSDTKKARTHRSLDERQAGINLRLVVGFDEIEEAARIVGEAAAVRPIAHEADPRPS